MRHRFTHLGTAIALLVTACNTETSTSPAPDSALSGPAPASEGANAVGGIIKTTPIGNPAWRPVGFRVFSGRLGTPASGFAEYLVTLGAIMPPPLHLAHPQLGIGPGQPHSPPYDLEIANGVAANHYKLGPTFKVADVTNGNAVILAWMTVPRGEAQGSSPDFSFGPIIPNGLFPINLAGQATRNGQVFDPYYVFGGVPALNDPALTPSFNVDGHSHFPFFASEADVFGPAGPLIGHYVATFTMIDQSGQGWKVVAQWTVTGPE